MAVTDKFCEDCALFREGDYCAYPRISVPGSALVRKSDTVALRMCAVERGHETQDSCGRAAKWFKHKSAEQVAA